MALYTLEGVVSAVKDIQTFDSGFRKREFVVSVQDGDYVQEIPLEVTKDRCDGLGGLAIGQPVSVDFALRGREWNGRHFINLFAVKITQRNQPATAPAVPQMAPAPVVSQPVPQQAPVQQPVAHPQYDAETPF